MTTLSRTLLATLLAAPLALPALAEEEGAERLAERLTVDGQAMPVESVREAPMEGLFEVRLETGEHFYSDAEGEHFLVGDLYRNGDQGLVNLTEEGRNGERA
ncbi:MAG: disulfide isomerase DsbC N-terminal domain-containing protein, partial [Halomonas sp.]